MPLAGYRTRTGSLCAVKFCDFSVQFGELAYGKNEAVHRTELCCRL